MPIGGLDMRGYIALAVIGAVLPAGAPAYAAPPPAADVEMAYGHPEIAADHSGVMWRWELTNRGAAGAESVVATHHVSAGQKVVGVSPPCAAGGTGDVVCSFGSIGPGEKRTGWIRTAVAPTGGTMRVNAQVTWTENPGILPGIEERPPVDAGAWGASRTDVATELPGGASGPR